jgi:hypothetical protein
MDREQEIKRVQALLADSATDDSRIEQLLQEAEDSGDYTEMTAQDWEDIEREGLALASSQVSLSFRCVASLSELPQNAT